MKNKRITALAAALLLVFGLPAFAGGPLNLNPNDPDGVERWPNGGVNIPFNPDRGGFANPGGWDNSEFVTVVVNSALAWQNVPTASNTYSNNGLMPVDIDETNFCSPPPFNPGPISFPGCHLIDNLFFGANVSDNLSPVVADEDGAIFNALGFGPGTLGFASPDTFLADGTPIEAIMFLNGGSVLIGGFPLVEFNGVTVHEFGHYSGLAHTVVNGQNLQFGDSSGPTPDNTFGNSPLDQETMYPFALVGGLQESPHQDDIAILSFLYPESGFLTNTATVTGTIFAPNNTTPLTGVNVIARNLNPALSFTDAVSSISGDRGVTGVYTINGLTPGQSYALFVDEILAGGFSTPPLSPLPGPEEFFNGANESNNADGTDDPLELVAVTPSAGVNGGIDIIFNTFACGDPLPVDDDGNVELSLPFPFKICGQEFNSVFVNANGNLTFGTGDADFTESVGEHLAGPPRIAGVWDDLSPFNLITGAQQGLVTCEERDDYFSIIYEDVPEFLNTGSNTFTIRLDRMPVDDDEDDDGDDDDDGGVGNTFRIVYGDLSATDGLAGYSCGGAVTSGLETASDLSELRQPIKTKDQTAVFELFDFANNSDLANSTLRFRGTTDFRDKFENNDSLDRAKRINLPFDTADAKRSFTDISPVGDDVDYFRFSANEGVTLVAEVTAGQLDSLLGLFQITSSGGDDDDDDGGGVTGVLLASDDDGGAGLLSRLVFPIPADGDYALAVTTFPDNDFTGDGNSGGRYVLDAFIIDGILLTLGDDNSVEVDLDFSFPFQGVNYNSVFVNSNGSLSFGTGDSDFSESVAEFLNGPPRIAPLWDDLSPNNAGLVIFDGDATSASITFQDVPEFLTTGANNFTVTLDASGDIAIDYGSVTAQDAIVGITEGGGASATETDLSAGGNLSATGTTFEQFTGIGDAFDLAFQSLFFLVP